MNKMCQASLLLLLSASTSLFAQEMVSWKAEVRLRSEADFRDFNNKTPANLYSLLRARLAADLKPSADVRIFLQVQDSRVLGSEQAAGAFSTLANTANLDLHQGFVRVQDFFHSGIDVTAGRMELAFGTQRMIGSVGWSNVGRSFDGLRLTSARSFGSIDLFALNTGETSSAPSVATPAGVAYAREGGQFLGGLYVTLTSFAPFLVDVFGMYEGDRKQTVPGTDDLSRYSIGLYGRGESGSIWYQVEPVLQFGKRSTRDISAYLLSGMVGMNFAPEGFTKAGLGADLLSGTSATSTRDQSFDPTFHTGHKFYGSMDYFIAIPGNTGQRGLLDVQAFVRYVPVSGMAVELTGHRFSLAEAQNGSKDVGNEFDLAISYQYNTSTRFEGGLSVFAPGAIMKSKFAGTDWASWAYLTLLVNI